MQLTTEQTAQLERILRDDVKTMAENAASWVFDGNTDTDTYRRVLAGIEDGDPEIMDALPFLDWSGQWADGPDWGQTFGDALECVSEDAARAWADGDLELVGLDGDLFGEVGEDYAAQCIVDAVAREARDYLAA
jgi:hypothetical protein